MCLQSGETALQRESHEVLRVLHWAYMYDSAGLRVGELYFFTMGGERQRTRLPWLMG